MRKTAAAEGRVRQRHVAASPPTEESPEQAGPPARRLVVVVPSQRHRLERLRRVREAPHDAHLASLAHDLSDPAGSSGSPRLSPDPDDGRRALRHAVSMQVLVARQRLERLRRLGVASAHCLSQ